MGYIPYLILAEFMGIHSAIITVSKVPVKAGGSISIPCLYDQKYKENIKFLCQGYEWRSCSKVDDTNQLKSNSGKFSISDDTNQGIFTVTINHITYKDTHYWCAVEKMGPDVGQYFHLLVTTDTPNLYVNQQEITVFEGGSVTVICHYKNSTERKWCRLGRPCVTDQSGSIDGTAVTINASVSNVFTVTMSKLKTESSGWYWCDTGYLQMPVHVTVNELPSTTMSPSTARTLSTTHQHSSLLTSVEPCTAQPTNPTGAGGENLQDENKRSTKVMILITTLVLQLLVVLAAFFGWRMIRHNKTKPGAFDTTAVSQTGSDPDVLYSTVVYMVVKQDQTPNDSVTYSTIVIRDGAKQMTEPEDGGVIYSMVGQH